MFISFKLTEFLYLQNDPDGVVYLTLETVLDGHSVLIFCPTKAWCEKLAEQIAREFFNIGKPNSDQPAEVGKRLREQLNSSRIAEVLQQLNRCPAGKDEILGATAAFGVAFHHAGLTYDERDILESAFKRGALRVIVATSTLSAGVNLPARRVIICSPVFNGQPLDPLTYKQMSGRAGRKGVDTEGYLEFLTGGTMFNNSSLTFFYFLCLQEKVFSFAQPRIMMLG